MSEANFFVPKGPFYLNELSDELKIKSVPTFYLFKGKELQGQCGGADIKKVHQLFKEHIKDE